jgi:hypothetical protein
MKYIEIIYSFIYRKDFFLSSGAILLFLVLLKPIETLLSNTIVKHIFSKINDTWYYDLLFIIIFLFLLIRVIHKSKKYTPSLNFTGLLVATTIVYIIYRITGEIWEFTPFYFAILSFLKYADILIIASIFQLLLFVKDKKGLNENEDNSFFDDTPLGEQGEDKLGFKKYAVNLTSKIKSSHFDKSFAIGINGKWGLGKTSFIDLLKRELDKEDVIGIDFNPWNSHSPKAIIKDFFDSVQEKTRPYHSSLSKLFIQYSKKLVALNSNTITQSFQIAASVVSGFESVNSLQKEINTTLEQINKKIIIYIDDLDRLDKDEIIEVIRLIRNTANFPNTFFIVAYDRNYLINSLKQHNPHNHEEFLEKIFQIEITLPYFEKEKLRQELARKLTKKLPKELYKIINDAILNTTSTTTELLNKWLDSLRDVTRLSNALLLNFKPLIEEVDFYDFLRVELLRLNYPSVYELIFRKTLEFFDTPTSQFKSKNIYKLKELTISEKNDPGTGEEGIKFCIELYITKNHSALSVPKNDISKIVDLLKKVFVEYSFMDVENSDLSIIYPSKFDRYFTYRLLEGNLSYSEFSKARGFSQKEFNSKISNWVKEGLEFELIKKFIEIHSFDNREDFEKIITAVFHLANQPSKKPEPPYRINVGYEDRYLINILSNYDNKIVDTFYSEVDGEEKLKTFIRSLFQNAKSPFSFESAFLYHVSSQIEPNFPLDGKEREEISINYLKNYALEGSPKNYNIWQLFRHCYVKNWKLEKGSSFSSKKVISQEAKNVMKDILLNKLIDKFIVDIIHPEMFENQQYAVSKIALELFNTWDAFEIAISKVANLKSEYLKEFKEFLSAFSHNDFSKHIEFEFKDIPV